MLHSIRDRKSYETRSARVAVAVMALFAMTACVTTTPTGVPSAAVPAAVQKRDGIAETLERGKEALKAGEFELAGRLYHHVLNVDPREPQAQLGLAEVSLAMGRLDVALRAFRAFEGGETDRPRALQGEGLVLLLKGRTNEAERRLKSAVDGDPMLWRAWNALGQVKDRKGEWRVAEDCYRKALKAKPDAASVYNNYGFSLLLQGRSDEAYGTLIRAIELEPTLEIAKSNLRLALAAQGRYSEALEGVDPQDMSVVLNNVGFVAMARDDYDNAETFLRDAIQGDPSFYRKATRNLEHLRSKKSGRAGRS